MVPHKIKPRSAAGCNQTKARGLDVLNSPGLNKGTAFTAEERDGLGLTGLLPPEINTLSTQVSRAWLQYERMTDPLSKNIYLTALHDRNEVLFYRLLSEHLREMIPIVNDLTVGMAIMQYQHESRRPRGAYLSIDHIDAMEQTFENLRVASGDIVLIVATDAEQIPGIGDWGVGGIEVSIGKLAIYTAAAGINPTRAIPVMLDVGTGRETLLNDPLYIGNRHPRVRGAEYDAFIDAYVATVTRFFPHAILQWVDFAPDNGRRILERYRTRMCTFNDDIQGMGAIVLAAVISALRVCAALLRNQRIVMFGAGMAGIGIADRIRDSMVHSGLTPEEAARRFWLVDSQGLLTTAMDGALTVSQSTYARPYTESVRWKREEDGGIGLAEVVRRVNPTMLIGTSGIEGSFTEAIVRDMAASTNRPIIFPLSHPPAHAEAQPADLISWTDGRALMASGGPVGPVTWRGTTYTIGQVSNANLYPGLCLGTIVARAARVSDGMFAAAAAALSSLVSVRQPGASLLPHTDDLRSVAATVAVAVAEAARAEGLARAPFPDIVQQVQDAMWQPEYRRIEAV